MNDFFRLTTFIYYINEVFKQCNDFKRNQYMGSNLHLKNSKHTSESETATSFSDQGNPFLVCIHILNCLCIPLLMWL